MNAVSESHAEADMNNILNTRTKLTIGCWNVRTMYEARKQAQVIREMKAYKLLRHVLVLFLSQIVDLDSNMFSHHHLLHLSEHSIE
jgi:hypothetical protein